ncbi:sodium:solute symporter [Aquimarina spongiae]|uniref:Solute:Na+ symporter, SSS family n=1 Tax=Aquimarina spongiae TaxID=570521 RepID=A0A1M6J599_9FLAO|nr:sodium:solute symporter [Aquimarina spongiae]SHJ41905.1 solute:Na+ symporter, SSS family [Aquimarina spongiae]
MGNEISTIDITVIVIYFIAVMLIGLYVARSTKTGEDLFLGGRSFGWGLIGLSLFASNISTSTIIGLSGAAYSSGIVQSVYEWMTGIPLIIAALIFIPLYLKSKITTIPEFLELRFDNRSRTFFSAITIFTSIVVDTAGGLYAGSIVLQAFFPELVIWQTCLILALVAGLYTAFGGLKAVVYTDAIQAIILIIGCSVLSYMLFEKLDFSWSNVVSNAPEGHLSIIRPADDESLPWPGLIMAVPILGFWYWTTNQYIVQRVLGAKNIQHARWGVILASFLKIVPLFIMVIPGAMAIGLFPGLENPDQVFPTTVMKVLPVGLVGLVLAGLISAIMSSVDSTLNSASTLVVIDFIKTRKKDITEKQVLNYGRITTVVLMIIAAVWAPLIANFGGIWAYLQQMFSIIVPPIAVLFLVGVFYKRGNGTGAFWTLILGTLGGVILFILGQKDIWTLHYTYNVGIMVVISTILFIVISQFSSPPEVQKIQLYTFNKELLKTEKEVSWYLDYRYHIVILLAAIGFLMIKFW